MSSWPSSSLSRSVLTGRPPFQMASAPQSAYPAGVPPPSASASAYPTSYPAYNTGYQHMVSIVVRICFRHAVNVKVAVSNFKLRFARERSNESFRVVYAFLMLISSSRLAGRLRRTTEEATTTTATATAAAATGPTSRRRRAAAEGAGGCRKKVRIAVGLPIERAHSLCTIFVTLNSGRKKERGEKEKKNAKA